MPHTFPQPTKLHYFFFLATLVSIWSRGWQPCLSSFLCIKCCRPHFSSSVLRICNKTYLYISMVSKMNARSNGFSMKAGNLISTFTDFTYYRQKTQDARVDGVKLLHHFFWMASCLVQFILIQLQQSVTMRLETPNPSGCNLDNW